MSETGMLTFWISIAISLSLKLSRHLKSVGGATLYLPLSLVTIRHKCLPASWVISGINNKIFPISGLFLNKKSSCPYSLAMSELSPVLASKSADAAIIIEFLMPKKSGLSIRKLGGYCLRAGSSLMHSFPIPVECQIQDQDFLFTQCPVPLCHKRAVSFSGSALHDTLPGPS